MLDTELRSLVYYLKNELQLDNYYNGGSSGYFEEYYDISGWDKDVKRYIDVVFRKRKIDGQITVDVSHNTDGARNIAIRVKNLLRLKSFDAKVTWYKEVKHYEERVIL